MDQREREREKKEERFVEANKTINENQLNLKSVRTKENNNNKKRQI